MADRRRLQHHITGLHHEGIALILIDQTHPTATHREELESHIMEMHVVGHLATGRITHTYWPKWPCK